MDAVNSSWLVKWTLPDEGSTTWAVAVRCWQWDWSSLEHCNTCCCTTYLSLLHQSCAQPAPFPAHPLLTDRAHPLLLVPLLLLVITLCRRPTLCHRLPIPCSPPVPIPCRCCFA